MKADIRKIFGCRSFFIVLFFKWLWAWTEENETFFSVYALSFAQFLGLSIFATSISSETAVGDAIFDLLIQPRCMMADGGCMMYHETRLDNRGHENTHK